MSKKVQYELHGVGEGVTSKGQPIKFNLTKNHSSMDALVCYVYAVRYNEKVTGVRLSAIKKITIEDIELPVIIEHEEGNKAT